MFKAYKDLRIGYYLSVFAGFILASLFIIFADINMILIDLFFIIWVFASNYLLSFIAVKRVNAVTALMNNQCNIRDYLSQTLALYGDAKGSITKMFLPLNLAAGYLALGDADTALFYLQSIAVDEERLQKKKIALAIPYYNNYTLAYIMKQDDKAAYEMLARMRRQLDIVKLKPLAKQQFESNYQLKRVRLNMRQGNYAGVEEYCIVLLQNSKMLFQQVVVCDILRDVYLHEGRWQEAQKCKEFILENGGDTYYVAKANAS